MHVKYKYLFWCVKSEMYYKTINDYYYGIYELVWIFIDCVFNLWDLFFMFLLLFSLIKKKYQSKSFKILKLMLACKNGKGLM